MVSLECAITILVQLTRMMAGFICFVSFSGTSAQRSSHIANSDLLWYQYDTRCEALTMAIDFPSSPTTGQQYTFAGVTYTYTAQGVWASAGASGYTASATAPVSPTPGDHWYDLTTGILAIYVNDGNSSQWVQVAPGTADTTAYVRTDITQVFTRCTAVSGTWKHLCCTI